MEWGLSNWKDILDVVVVPAVLGLIALAWPSVQAGYRRRAFLRLIRRELQEIEPFPDEKTAQQSNWIDHRQRYRTLRPENRF